MEAATEVKKDRVAVEVCESEYERFLEAMDLKEKTESKNLDAEDKKSLSDVREVFINAMRRGSLIVNEKGEAVFTPQMGGDPITFHEPTGADIMAMDFHKAGQQVHKFNAVLAAVTHTNTGLFAKMPRRDYRVCQSILSLFLA